MADLRSFGFNAAVAAAELHELAAVRDSGAAKYRDARESLNDACMRVEAMADRYAARRIANGAPTVCIGGVFWGWRKLSLGFVFVRFTP